MIQNIRTDSKGRKFSCHFIHNSTGIQFVIGQIHSVKRWRKFDHIQMRFWVTARSSFVSQFQDSSYILEFSIRDLLAIVSISIESSISDYQWRQTKVIFVQKQSSRLCFSRRPFIDLYRSIKINSNLSIVDRTD